MADLSPPVSFCPVAWCERTATDLRRIADVSPRDLAIFRGAVKAGRFELWAICTGGARIGSVIWSTEAEPDGFNIVINAAAVDHETARADVTGALWDAFEQLGRATGARALIAWTERAGLARKLEQRGARRKTVLELDLQ